MSNYSAFTNSEVYWIENIPSHWDLLHLKSCVSKKITDGPHDTPIFYDDGVPFLSAEAVFNGRLNISSMRGYISKDTDKIYSKKVKPKKNDIFIVKSGSTTGKIGYVDTDEDFNIWSPLALVRVNRRFFSRFLFQFLTSSFFQKQVQVSWSFGTQPNIGMGVIERLQVLCPPLEEQQAIADYLDAKTKQIDRKIELLEAKVEKYAELKQSLINEMVTRGLDKSAPMKDSDVEWIGQIPAHWGVERVNDIAAQQKIKNIGLREKNLLSLSYGKLKRKDMETSFGLLPESFETYQIINEGNIILRLTDLQNDWTSLRVGLARERGIITSAYLCLRFSKQIYPTFAYYLLHTYDLRKVFYWLGSGLRSVMKFDDIKVLPFILPPLEEQKTIADYLEVKTAHIEKIVETIHLEIKKLQELRKTLINDVVTGKIKVYQS